MFSKNSEVLKLNVLFVGDPKPSKGRTSTTDKVAESSAEKTIASEPAVEPAIDT